MHQSYLEPILNEHGAEGWELVSAFLTPNLTTFIFKRHIEGAAKSQDEAAA